MGSDPIPSRRAVIRPPVILLEFLPAGQLPLFTIQSFVIYSDL
jgi:hypothetical protein